MVRCTRLSGGWAASHDLADAMLFLVTVILADPTSAGRGSQGTAGRSIRAGWSEARLDDGHAAVAFSMYTGIPWSSPSRAVSPGGGAVTPTGSLPPDRARFVPTWSCRSSNSKEQVLQMWDRDGDRRGVVAGSRARCMTSGRSRCAQSPQRIAVNHATSGAVMAEARWPLPMDRGHTPRPASRPMDLSQPGRSAGRLR